MCEVGCLFTLLESGDQRCKKGTRGAAGEETGHLTGFARESTYREGNGRHEVHFGVSNTVIKCSFVTESEQLFFSGHNNHHHQALSWAN